MNTTVHIPVMLEESMLVLRPRDGGVYVDGTLGGGSHTEALLKASAPHGRVFSFEIYPDALALAERKLRSYGDRWEGIDANFALLADELEQRGVRSVDGILLDLGFSSDELEDPRIGLSFLQEGVLDMRLGPKANTDGLTAAEVVNTWDVAALTELFEAYGDEKYAFPIAKAIERARREAYIVSTTQLAEVVIAAVSHRYEHGRIHPATRVFLALRTLVNEELEHIRAAVQQAERILAPGGRLAIITFQSIEDRLVKKLFQQEGWFTPDPQPLAPSAEECERNPRARSAKLRYAERQS